MKLFIYIWILCLFIPGKFFSADIYIDNKILQLNQTQVGHNSFVKPTELTDKFKVFTNYKENKLYLNNAVITFSKESFFIVYESSDEMKVHQMPSTPLEINGEQLLPVISIFNAFNSFGIMNVEIANDKIIIHSSGKMNLEEKSDNINFISSTQKKNLNIEKEIKIIVSQETATVNLTNSNIRKYFYELSSEITPYFDYNKAIDTLEFRRTDYPPNIYLIPNNLKRNDE